MRTENKEKEHINNGRDPVIVNLADAPAEDGKFVTKALVLGHAALVA